MAKHKNSKKTEALKWRKWVITAILVPIVIAVITTLISIIGPVFIKPPVSPSPTPTCISEADILITFQVLKNNEVIAEPAPGETILLDSDSLVYFKPEIKSVSNSTLPELECQWTNTGIATEGKLLHNAGCNMVDYQSGHTYIKDAVAMQIRQPSCSALAPYSLFIMPK